MIGLESLRAGLFLLMGFAFLGSVPVSAQSLSTQAKISENWVSGVVNEDGRTLYRAAAISKSEVFVRVDLPSGKCSNYMFSAFFVTESPMEAYSVAEDVNGEVRIDNEAIHGLDGTLVSVPGELGYSIYLSTDRPNAFYDELRSGNKLRLRVFFPGGGDSIVYTFPLSGARSSIDRASALCKGF